MAKNAVGKAKTRLPLIGLVLVVKNGEQTLPRLLMSALPLIGSWTVCDTGSTDNTKLVVKAMLGHLPGRLYEHKWKGYAHNYNLALDRAQGTARWLLHLHADEEVTFVNPNFIRWLARGRKTEGFDVSILDHGTTISLPRLLRGDLRWRYEFPTHEYLIRDGRAILPLTGFQITHHGKPEGADYIEKLEGDIELLRPLFRKRDPRAVFYTAESHRYLGHDIQAALIYDLRAQLNDYEEERWYSVYQAARLRKDVEALIEAWRERPWRHEPLTAAGKIIHEAHERANGDRLFLESV